MRELHDPATFLQKKLLHKDAATTRINTSVMWCAGFTHLASGSREVAWPAGGCGCVIGFPLKRFRDAGMWRKRGCSRFGGYWYYGQTPTLLPYIAHNQKTKSETRVFESEPVLWSFEAAVRGVPGHPGSWEACGGKGLYWSASSCVKNGDGLVLLASKWLRWRFPQTMLRFQLFAWEVPQAWVSKILWDLGWGVGGGGVWGVRGCGGGGP